MRILLLSDIHSNLVALQAVLAAAGPYDDLWCLGDIVGYGPAPNECCQLLRERKASALAGNHDWGVLGKLELEDFNVHARRALLWTDRVLTGENRDWLAELADRVERTGDDLTLVHGSPRYPIWEYVVSTGVATENMSHFSTSACFFGHTHIPILFSLPEGKNRAVPRPVLEGQPLALPMLGKCMLNPGSVGQPRDRDPRAAYALLDLETRTVTCYRVAYDLAQTQAAMARVELPQPLIDRLAFGI